MLQHRVGSVGRHVDRLPAHSGTTAEWQVYGCTIPVVENVAPAGGKRDRKDRPPRLARQQHDAAARAARDLRHVRAESDRLAGLKSRKQRPKRTQPPLAQEFTAVIARAADQFYTEALRRYRIDLGVAMARDQRLAAIARPPHERSQEMLAVPHRENHRQAGINLCVAVRWIDREARSLEYETQILGGERA